MAPPGPARLVARSSGYTARTMEILRLSTDTVIADQLGENGGHHGRHRTYEGPGDASQSPS
jgi:hypothetical protein